jgi:hypothetical protein
MGRMFQKQKLCELLRFKTEEVKVRTKELHHQNRHISYFTRTVTAVSKTKRRRWAGHVAHTEDMRKYTKSFDSKLVEERLFENRH